MGSGRIEPTDPGRERSPAAAAFAFLCAISVVFLVARDLFVPDVRATEVWFGFEFHGWTALLTTPIHWAIFATFAWGFWTMRPWIWRVAGLYACYVALGHVVWNLTSPRGGGGISALWQWALFSIPAVAILWARPRSAKRE